MNASDLPNEVVVERRGEAELLHLIRSLPVGVHRQRSKTEHLQYKCEITIVGRIKPPSMPLWPLTARPRTSATLHSSVTIITLEHRVNRAARKAVPPSGIAHLHPPLSSSAQPKRLHALITSRPDILQKFLMNVIIIRTLLHSYNPNLPSWWHGTMFERNYGKLGK